MQRVISQKEIINAAGAVSRRRIVRVVGLDTLSPRMFPPVGPYVVRMTPASLLSELRALLNKQLQEINAEDVIWAHFIKHRKTLKVLRTEFAELPQEPNYSTYKYTPGDILLVATPRRRPHPCLLLMPEDLSYWLVTAELQTDAVPKL
jgi:hypothetical protein